MKNMTLGLLFALLLAMTTLVGCDTSGEAAIGPTSSASEKEHQFHDDHKDHDDHGEKHNEAPEHGEEEEHETRGHDDADSDHEDEDVIRLSAEELKEFDIETAKAGPGKLEMFIDLPGEIVINSDRLAHIVPRVSGVVRRVNKKLGDQVKAGEVMATLESRELAGLKVAFLSARERYTLAKEIFKREEKLWQKQITAEQDFLSTKQALVEARIELRSAEQTLHALGFSEQDLAQQSDHDDANFTRYEITAPFDGTVIEKHITLGEALKDDSETFIVADLKSVWVDISVYQKDLPFIKEGQSVVISAGHGAPDGHGKISYVGPTVGEKTRTALARIVLDNKSGLWRPGMFVTAKIASGNIDVPLLISRSALQTLDDHPAVFVRTKEGFEPTSVKIGRGNAGYVEIIKGLEPDQEYVQKGSFTLKAQLSKGAFGDGHNH